MTELSHSFLAPALHRQAVCVDATLGRGKDARFFLDQGVRQVIAYEIQQETFQAACASIQDSRFSPRLKSHDEMEQDLRDLTGKVDAVVFNFGYDPLCPGGLTTTVSSSVSAIVQAARLLRVRGRMALVFYPHEQGRKEKQQAMKQLEDMDGLQVLEISHPFCDRSPSLVCVEKMRQGANNGQ